VVCPPAPAAADKVADFENGSINTLRVGARGGTPWAVISLVEGSTGTVAPQVIPETCGSRGAIRFSGTNNANRGPLVRALLTETTAANRFVDARAYSGLLLWLRSVPAGRVRVKISDQNTTPPGGICVLCNNHFLIDLDVDGQLRPYLVPFARMTQESAAERQPALAEQALFAIEISPPRIPSYDVLIDDISFVE
jgi:hypothetical protein